MWCWKFQGHQDGIEKPPDYNAMNKGSDSKRETGARRKVLPNLASSLSAASISGNPAPPSSVSASTFLPSVASSSDEITNVNVSITTIQRKTSNSNEESLEVNVAISQKNCK